MQGSTLPVCCTIIRSMVYSYYVLRIDRGTMSTVTVSPKFQVVIPRDVRKSLGITVGQKIRVIALGDRIEFIPIRPAKALRGFVRGIDSTVPRDRDRM